jgi:D-xylose transport system permease protein
MTEAAATQSVPSDQAPRSLRSLISSTEIDLRFLGLIALLAVIWIGFNIASDGNYITPRNLWNLSVQSASTAVMATGMVLVIVSRNIDLSIGSMLGLIAYVMAVFQSDWLPKGLGLGFEQPYTWILALALGLALGAICGGIQGFLVAYGGVPAFIVTLGGLLVWRGLIFRFAQGQTIAPLDTTFQMLGAGTVTAGGVRVGALGETLSWVLGIAVCVGIIYVLVSGRRRRQRYGFPVRPLWAEIGIGVAGCGATLLAIWVANSYPLPALVATQYAQEHGITEPAGGLIVPIGVAYPVLILIGVSLVMTIIATRRRFGRYVYAIGGNPEAAELGGINTRRTIMFTFVLMGMLVAISAAIQSARLNAAVTGLGVQAELDVITAAVIGGTSFTGGVGTIVGAVIGALVAQSLRSGMLLLNVDSPTQDVVVGIVLVGVVGLDSYFRRRGGR